MASRNVCGNCNEGFENEDQYLDHQCAVTGFTPRDPQNLGERFAEISKAAIERGEERKQAEPATAMARPLGRPRPRPLR